MNEPLRMVPLLADIPEDYLRALGAGVAERTIAPGEFLFREGAPARDVYFLLAGEIELTGRVDGREVALSRVVADQLSGQIAIMAAGRFPAGARAVTTVRAVALPAIAVRRMASATAEAGARQVEKLTALGRLAAGLAHELNNPAAAAHRAAQQLGDTLADLYRIGMGLHRYNLSPQQWDYLRDFQQDLVRRAAEAQPLPPLDQSDREERIGGWLAGCGVKEDPHLAPVIVRAGWDLSRLEEVASHMPAEAMPDVITWLCGTQSVVDLQRQIALSAASIHELVEAVRAYSHLDRTPDHDVCVNEGLEDTLTILNHKLGQGIVVHREYDRNLPRLRAWGSELNQVWTNLIDNAIDALHGRGEIWIRTRLENERILVEVADSGEGIPEHVQARIFEPFFTTKPQVKGGGLGLDIARRIVTERYGGDISFRSAPGDTRFYVRLPLAGAVGDPLGAMAAVEKVSTNHAE